MGYVALKNRRPQPAARCGSLIESLETRRLLATLTTLATFDGTNGSFPSYGVTVHPNGSLYGTTDFGGASNKGTLFKLAPDGTLTTLASFRVYREDTVTAGGRLSTFVDASGNLYGTIRVGPGPNLSLATPNATFGTVFKVTPAGTFTQLAAFGYEPATGGAGRSPSGELVVGSAGNIYGTAASGGAPSGSGTVFKITPGGALSALARFNGANGEGPQHGLIADAAGNLYGTTVSSATDSGASTVFKVTPGGTLSTLATLGDSTSDPLWGSGQTSGKLVADAAGNLYGTTGGGELNFGTVFKVTPAGTVSRIATFNNSNGSVPTGLSIDAAGNLFGVTLSGGENDLGTVFKLTPDGTLSSLVMFDGAGGGGHPSGELNADAAGNLYGTTYDGGGTDRYGTVFKLAGSGYVTAAATNFGSITSRALKIAGTEGDDRISFSLSDSTVTVTLGSISKTFARSDFDRIEVQAGLGDDRVDMGAVNVPAYLSGGSGDDTLVGSEANDTLLGGGGSDRLYGRNGKDRVAGSGGRDFCYGEAGDDRVYGDAGNDLCDGGGNRDRVFGGDGDDYIVGGSSVDRLYGDAGNDQFVGGPGNDYLFGGDGTDEDLVFDAGDIVDSIEVRSA